MRGRLTPVGIGLSALVLLVVMAPAADAQTPGGGPPTHGELLPGGAGVGAGYHEFEPDGGQAEVPPTGMNTNRECWIEYGEDLTSARRVSLGELQAALVQWRAAGNEKLPATRVCQDIGGGNPIATPIQWPPDEGEDFLVSPELLMQQAFQRIWYPSPIGGMSPALGTGTFAQLPTHYWVTNMAPGPTVRAQAGPVWAEVVAEAISQEWVIEDDLRDDQTFSCAGPGAPFDGSSGGAPPADACAPWEPAHSSAGQSTIHPVTGEPCFAATVTITWEVSWTSSENSTPQGLGTDTSAASTCIVVQELQAVVSSDGDG